MKYGDLSVQELSDRARINDVLVRYCRGLDRCDVELLKSVVHEDAVADHGVGSGNAMQFYESLAKEVQVWFDKTTHSIANVFFERLGPDIAFTETHIFAYHAIRGDKQKVEAVLGSTYLSRFDWSKVAGVPHEFIVKARYADRFEKRNGEWRIANRTVITDWWQSTICSAVMEQEGFFPSLKPLGCRGLDDPSYGLLK